MRIIFLSTAALTLIATPAMAQSVSSTQVSGSVGYTVLDGDGVSLGAITGRVTARLSPYFGVEGEASFGTKDDTATFGAVTGNLSHEYDVAAYGFATLPLSPNFELFARVGYGSTQLKAELASFSVTEDGESVNYGAGANYFFDAQNGVRADWTRRDFTDGNGGALDTYGLSYVRRF
jgi:outer membrane immunogenic protein